MRVEEWFYYWLDRHMERHPRDDWPRASEAPDFYRGWIGNFVVAGLTEDVADEASIRLMAAPPPYRSEHVKATVDMARKVFVERAMSGASHDPDSREAATAASVACDDCGGATGLTVRWRKHSADHPGGPTVVLYCRCPLGRWVEMTHRKHAPEVRKRIHDLADHPFLYGRGYRQPADGWDAYRDRPTPYTLDDLKGRLAADRARPGSTAPVREVAGAFRPEALPPEVRAVWEHPRVEPEYQPREDHGDGPAF